MDQWLLYDAERLSIYESVEVEDVEMTFTDDCSASQAFVSVRQEGERRILSQAETFREGLQTAWNGHVSRETWAIARPTVNARISASFK